MDISKETKRKATPKIKVKYSEKLFNIAPVFLDFTLDLDGLIDEIDKIAEFRDYMGELFYL